MIEQLPEGNSIGWMQAPPQWIFTHTVRFIGVVRIVIQDGEGFILIKKGKPIFYYFKHGRIELKGHSALDYFNSHPTIEFNLCKYNPEEFALALKICNIEEENPEEKPESESRKITLQKSLSKPSVQNTGQLQETSAFEEIIQRPLFPSKENPPEEPVTVPLTVVLEEPDIKLIGQIKKLNGIVAISVFSDERNILLMGDVDIEPLLKIARSMLATTRKISPLVEWGSFVHMTLQIPEGNVIIAPYHDFYLCLLTTRTINIGHIRRILRDLQLTTDIRD
jgi:hypothetical protein